MYTVTLAARPPRFARDDGKAPWHFRLRLVRSRMGDRATSVHMTLALCLLYGFVVIGGAIVFCFWNDIPFKYVFGEPAMIMRAPTYIGMISNIGVLMWVAAGSIFLFGGSTLYYRHGLIHTVAFMLAFGLFTLVLAVDDLFMLHESSRFGHTHEQLVVGGYVVTLATLLVFFRRLILKTNYLILWVALFFFSISVTVDMLVPIGVVFEDGAKFIGITLWLAYFIRTGAWAMHTNAWQDGPEIRRKQSSGFGELVS